MSKPFLLLSSVPAFTFLQTPRGCSEQIQQRAFSGAPATGHANASRNLCFTLIAALLWCSGSMPVAAQTESWDIVRSLASGQEIRVETTDRKLRGSLLSV